MSELLDKQVDTENENPKVKIPGFTQALVKCVKKIKEELEEKQLPAQNFFIERRTTL